MKKKIGRIFINYEINNKCRSDSRIYNMPCVKCKECGRTFDRWGYLNKEAPLYSWEEEGYDFKRRRKVKEYLKRKENNGRGKRNLNQSC